MSHFIFLYNDEMVKINKSPDNNNDDDIDQKMMDEMMQLAEGLSAHMFDAFISGYTCCLQDQGKKLPKNEKALFAKLEPIFNEWMEHRAMEMLEDEEE